MATIFPFITNDMLIFLVVFIFSFAISYGVLIKARIFGSRITAVISMVIGFFSAMYEPLANFMMKILPWATILFLIGFIIMFLKDVFGKKKDLNFLHIALLVVVLLLMGVLGNDIFKSMPAMMMQNVIYIIGIIIIGAILYIVHSNWSSGGGQQAPTN